MGLDDLNISNIFSYIQIDSEDVFKVPWLAPTWSVGHPDISLALVCGKLEVDKFFDIAVTHKSSSSALLPTSGFRS